MRGWLRPIAFLVTGLLSSCCGVTMSSGKYGSDGEWLYAFCNKAVFNPNPPTFDVMDIKENGQITLTSSMRREVIEGVHADKGDLWEIKFKNPHNQQEESIQCKRKYMFDLDALLIGNEHGDHEWVYFRREVFEGFDISGTWECKSSGGTTLWTLGRMARVQWMSTRVITECPKE